MDLINIIGTIFDNSIEHVVALAHQIKDLRLDKNQQDINQDLYEQIRISKETKEKSKGYYDSYQSLIQNVPDPEIGDWAIVKNSSDNKWYIYKCIVKGSWRDTGETYSQEIDLQDYTKTSDFKTINGQSILLEEGSEDTDIVISGGGGREYSLADENTDGLLSKEDYSSLQSIKGSLNIIEENLNNILQLLNEEEDTSDIQRIIDKYREISEFIESLDDSDRAQILMNMSNDISNLQETVEQILSDIEDIKDELGSVKDDNVSIKDRLDTIENAIDTINGEYDGSIGDTIISLIQRVGSCENSLITTNESVEGLSENVGGLISNTQELDQDLKELTDRVSQLEEYVPITPIPTPSDSLVHVVVTKSQYNSLQEYDEDTLYLIIEEDSNNEGGWTFPIILGGAQRFPIELA